VLKTHQQKKIKKNKKNMSVIRFFNMINGKYSSFSMETSRAQSYISEVKCRAKELFHEWLDGDSTSAEYLDWVRTLSLKSKTMDELFYIAVTTDSPCGISHYLSYLRFEMQEAYLNFKYKKIQSTDFEVMKNILELITLQETLLLVIQQIFPRFTSDNLDVIEEDQDQDETSWGKRMNAIFFGR
jgi:hypothetical protein